MSDTLLTPEANTRLVVNPMTRTLAPKYRRQKAVYVAKGDHNSVLIAFEMPRYVDGYDMSAKENAIQIHYANISSTDTTKYSKGFSDAVNVKVETDEATREEVVSFCWLVPNTATKYAGTVSVGITFERYDVVDGELQEIYSWSTAPYGETIVWDSMDNSKEAVDREYNYLVTTCNALVKAMLEEAKESGEFDGESIAVTPQRFGAKGDGATDDTKAFQDAIDYAAENGMNRVFVPKTEKPYLVKALTLRSNIEMFGSGTLRMTGEAINPDSPNSICVFGSNITDTKIEGLSFDCEGRIVRFGVFNDSSNVLLKNIKVAGHAWSDDLTLNETALVGGIDIEDSKNITVDGLKLTRVNGWGVCFDNCKDSKIVNSEITYTSRGGIYMLYDCENCLIENNVLDYTVLHFEAEARDGAIDLYGDNSNITIQGNHVKYYGWNDTYPGIGIRVKSGDNNRIVNNNIEITSPYSNAGISVAPRNMRTEDNTVPCADTNNVSVIGNNITVTDTGNTSYFISLSTSYPSSDRYINDVIISQNTFRSYNADLKTSEVIFIRNHIKNLLIEKNRFLFVSNSKMSAIYCRDDGELNENYQIKDNLFVGGYVRFRDLRNGFIEDNIFYNYYTRPIKIYDCENVYIVRNIAEVKSGVVDAVHEEGGTNTNIVKDNMITHPKSN